AAGEGTRFGGTKQIRDLRGKPLVQHAVDAAAEAGLDEVVVVVGHDAGRVRAALRLPPSGRVVENPRFPEGLATSLAAGLDACDPASEGAVVLLADQPGIAARHVRALADAFRRSGAWIVRLRFRDGPGPALLSRAAWEEARALSGDVGARALVERDPERVVEVPVDEPAPPDVDRPEDLARAARGDG
ncbi:MAG TPA: nucleotidyltransferase family protein, partial [Actinomycetota bacterium]|nr:nucleotidyltransferase family protein [Actinomycetota bacterium]